MWFIARFFISLVMAASSFIIHLPFRLDRSNTIYTL
jgi:hypothetical protein